MLKRFPLGRFLYSPLLVSVVSLSLLGLMMVYSTGLSGEFTRSLWLRQALALVLGLVGFFFFSTLDYRSFKKSASWLYSAAVLLLIAVLFIGVTVKGATRWLPLGVFNFQPAELSKFALIVILAKFIQGRGVGLQRFRYVGWSGAFAAIPVMLIMIQPDLGSAIVHVAIWIGMLAASSMPRRFFLYLLVGFLIFAVVAWQFLLAPYQKDRIHTFLDPAADPLGRGYNVIQSTVAIGSGGLFGTGLARGLQSQLRFLPERQTDFIFASTVEELGMFGGGLVLLLLGYALVRILRIMESSRDLFGRQLAAGIFFLLFTQGAVNVGMNLGLLPVTGITLPFLSYGGSSLVINFWLVGILESIARQSSGVRFG